ncbi:MAG: carbohydrate ABC transporter permease [Nocardioides sp.]
MSPLSTGLENYRDLLSYDLFWQSFRIGLVWAVSVTFLQFASAMGLALLLHQNLRFGWFARVLALVPWAMPPVVVGIMWRLMYDPNYGPVNSVLQAVGFSGSTNLLGNFSTALPAAIVVGVWAGMPQTTIALLAGLQGIDDAMHEAAAIDGAGVWRRFRHITLPQLKPVIIAITPLNFIWNINTFDLIYVLTNGGPGGRTMLPMLFAYNEAFRYGNFGTAAAMGNVMVILIVGALVFYLRSRSGAPARGPPRALRRAVVRHRQRPRRAR